MSQHQAGALKQSNKKHKGPSGKRDQKRCLGPGRVAKSNSSSGSKHANRATHEHKNSFKDARNKRKNQANQQRSLKKNDILLQRRLGSNHGPPKIVNIVCMSDQTNTSHTLKTTLSEAIIANADKINFDESSPSDVIYASIAKFHSNFSFILSTPSDLFASIDASRVTDIMLFATTYSPTDFSAMISEEGLHFITALKALGCPDIVFCVDGLNNTAASTSNANAKHGKTSNNNIVVQNSLLKTLKNHFETLLSMPVEVFDAENSAQLCRHLSSMSSREVTWRSTRSYLVADSIEVLGSSSTSASSSSTAMNTTYINTNTATSATAIPSSSSNTNNNNTNTTTACTLKLNGYLRGCPLYLHSLGHIPGVGTCRIARVEMKRSSDNHSKGGPFSSNSSSSRKGNSKSKLHSSNNDTTSDSMKGDNEDDSNDEDEEEENDETFVYEADIFKQDSLIMSATGDALMGEQTWPSDHEIAAATAATGTDSHGNNLNNPMDGRSRRNLPQHIPTGMSSYQADWFLDEEGQFDDATAKGKSNSSNSGNNYNGNDGSNNGVGHGITGFGSNNNNANNNSDNNNNNNNSNNDIDVDDDGAQQWVDDNDEDENDNGTMDGSLLDGTGAGSLFGGNQTKQGLVDDKKLRRQASEDHEFPDEMDTPQDMTARARFARYRALQSFRSSPWHTKENLPYSYSQIYQFDDFLGTQRRALNESKQVSMLQKTNHLSAVMNRKKALSQHIKSRRGSTTNNSINNDDHDNNSDFKMNDDGEYNGDNNNDNNNDDDGMDVHTIGGGGSVMTTATGVTGITGRSRFNDAASVAATTLVPGADDYLCAGTYISLILTDVPLHALERIKQKALFTWFSLLRHENKHSVLNFNIQRISSNYNDEKVEPIKSKQELVFMAGFRSFTVKPIFSEGNLNCDKHKLERFLLPDRFSVATCFGPICYQPCPLLVFNRNKVTGDLQLIATGNLRSVNPDRIVLKKIILTGLPIRVRKKFAVVKHLFYDPQDVRWFKPAELVTKHGLRGKIKEPVGTHGLMKVGFSGPIKQNDTIMLVLYKRVFPKFPTEGIVVN